MSKTIKKKSSRSRIDYSEKLKKLEEEKQQLILQRKEEIFSIIEKTNCLSIDNELLAGAFTIIKEIDGKQTEELSDNLKAFELLMREKAPAFFRRKFRVRKS